MSLVLGQLCTPSQAGILHWDATCFLSLQLCLLLGWEWMEMELSYSPQPQPLQGEIKTPG